MRAAVEVLRDFGVPHGQSALFSAHRTPDLLFSLRQRSCGPRAAHHHRRRGRSSASTRAWSPRKRFCRYSACRSQPPRCRASTRCCRLCRCRRACPSRRWRSVHQRVGYTRPARGADAGDRRSGVAGEADRVPRGAGMRCWRSRWRNLGKARSLCREHPRERSDAAAGRDHWHLRRRTVGPPDRDGRAQHGLPHPRARP